MDSYLKSFKEIFQEEGKKSWKPFGICLLNSTADLLQFGWKWVELAVQGKSQTAITIFFSYWNIGMNSKFFS